MAYRLHPPSDAAKLGQRPQACLRVAAGGVHEAQRGERVLRLEDADQREVELGPPAKDFAGDVLAAAGRLAGE